VAIKGFPHRLGRRGLHTSRTVLLAVAALLVGLTVAVALGITDTGSPSASPGAIAPGSRTRSAPVASASVSSAISNATSPPAVSSASAEPGQSPVPGEATPLAGATLWVDPSSAAARQVSVWQAEGQSANAARLTRIAGQPFAIWLTDTSAATITRLREQTQAAAAAGRVPTFVAYNIPDRDCGGHSQGGAASTAAYSAWIKQVATTIGQNRVIVVLEPDALPDTVQGCAAALANQRYLLLAGAVQTLKANPGTTVYLDAGNPGFPTNPRDLVDPLRRSGIARADGFTVNVANFYTTVAAAAYGAKLSAALGGAHFVIDTGRNGAGPLPPGSGYAGPAWCNPPGRKIGQAPTVSTGIADVDAFLWIKRPGESDGSCAGGAPGAGTWFPSYALSLAS
jgi:endoglucanase